MNLKHVIYLFAIFCASFQMILASDSPTAFSTYNKTRQEHFEAQKNVLSEEEQKRLQKRSQARKLQEGAQVVVGATETISTYMSQLPLSIQQQNPTTAVAVLNKLAWGVGTVVRAIGRRQEAMQAVLSTNEQLLEATVKSYEDILKLTHALEDLLHPKTILEAVKDLSSSQTSKTDKLLSLLKPQHYLNTFDKFTDNLYITNNKAQQWEMVKKTVKELIEEEKRFDDYIALLQIKVLERQLMNLHKLANFNAAIDPKTKQITKKPGYKAKLEQDLKTVDAAIGITETKLRETKENQPASGGLMNKLKKTIGKDEKTQQEKELLKLQSQLNQYKQQKKDIEAEIQQFQTMSVDSIDADTKQLIHEINNIKQSRATDLTPAEMADQITDLRKQVQNLQSDMNTLKARTGQSNPSAIASRALPTKTAR